MKNDPISHYEDSNYPSKEEFMESYKKNRIIKSGAAVLVASLVGLSLAACEPPSDISESFRTEGTVAYEGFDG